MVKVKKLIVPLAAIGLGILFLLIPGLEPLGAITLLGGLGAFGAEGLTHGK
jgi:hypothetical protein